MLIAAAFSLGTALDYTQAAKVIADSLIYLLAPLGGAGILAGYALVSRTAAPAPAHWLDEVVQPRCVPARA